MDIGARTSDESPRRAVGYYLAAARALLPVALQSGHDDVHVMYNISCGQVVALLSELDHDWQQPIDIPGPAGNVRLRFEMSGDGGADIGQFDRLWLAKRLEIVGLDEAKRVTQAGLGAPLVGHREGTPQRRLEEPFLSPAGLASPLTATLEFDGVVATMAFHDTMIASTAEVNDRTVFLSADFTAPLMLLLNFTPDENVAWAGLRRPDRYSHQMGLYQLEPFRSGQIPVVFVHGLLSSPETWLEALNALRADPVIRARYQMFFFIYPTGYPVSYSASRLRAELAQLRAVYDPEGKNSSLQNLVLVGHSMGGILVNMQIRSSKQQLLGQLFNQPFDSLEGFDETQRATLEKMFEFEANPDVARAIFVATPHRGSVFAEGSVGALGSDLVESAVISDLLQGVRKNHDTLTPLGKSLVDDEREDLNSIESLRPGAPILHQILNLPTSDEVTLHSVIGHLGPGSDDDGGDGVVSYDSAHLADVDSEKRVAASHTAITEDPATIEEIRRILYLNAGVGF
jgi:triacylglycerol esterase/lipase EstA (alpha/beta hydrolase family)